MKIKNKKKFAIGITIVILVIVFIILLSNQSLSNVECKTKNVFITKGDTLWTIASEEQQYNKYYENKSIKEIIYDIKKINNLDSGYIYDGEKLEIPYI